MGGSEGGCGCSRLPGSERKWGGSRSLCVTGKAHLERGDVAEAAACVPITCRVPLCVPFNTVLEQEFVCDSCVWICVHTMSEG